ncbi:hypothetical protein AYO44_16880 [Planctomycetaceae bacterium SCGC AG-212-F19]|nr:hypothetical protein AYO44_16880 [Planctomycetaceae bacterium SCGC AG-212-F19]
MSSQRIHFGRSEMMVRVTCQAQAKGRECGAVLEIPAEHLTGFIQQHHCKCPICGNDFHAPSVGRKTMHNPFEQLGLALDALGTITAASVDFTIPAPDTRGPADRVS